MPIYAFVNGSGFGPRQLAHLVMIAVPTRHRLGNAPAGRAASVRRMIYIVAFADNQVIDQLVNMFLPNTGNGFLNHPGRLPEHPCR